MYFVLLCFCSTSPPVTFQKASSKMSVETGKAALAEEDAKALEAEEFRLRAMMVKKKHRPLYK